MADCRFCLKKDTCKRNKANASSCRLYDQDNEAYGKYQEELELQRIESRKKLTKILRNDPVGQEFMEYVDAYLRSR